MNVIPHASFDELVPAVGLPGRGEGDGGMRQRPVVVPSLAFGDELRRRLADRFGICMGWRFVTPRDFVHEAVGPGPASPWSAGRLVWAVLPHVEKFAKHLGSEPVSPRERFALAGSLADSLDQYGHFRPGMIRRWARGQWAGAAPLDGEDWQRELWTSVDNDIRAAHPGVGHPALEMERLRGDEEFLAGLARRFPSVLILGSGSLDPIMVEVAGLLEVAGAGVTVRVLLPSMGYLADLRRRAVLPAADSDPGEPLESDGGHPLLAAMGRQSVGTFALLGELDEHYTHWPEPAGAAAPQDAGLLARMQSDIRALREPAPRAVAAEGDMKCPSLRVHACHGARREMEVLRDEILRAFVEIDGLRPDEVHIVTPDPATYAPLVSAILTQGDPRLPVRLGERPGGAGDPAVEAALALLEFVRAGLFCASGVLKLAGLPAVVEFFGVEDTTLLSRWIRESGLTHGTVRDRPGSAGFARDRVVAGKWLGGDGDYPGDVPALPVADEWDGEATLRSRLTDWLLTLEALFGEWSRPAPAREWAGRLERAAGRLFAADPEDSPDWPGHQAFLASVDCAEDLCAGTVLDWMSARAGGAERGGAFAGQIAFGRFRQLQHLPCRVLAMVGLHDANFPAKSGAPAWDLLRAAPKSWDRNPRSDDRQLFLDAILTPTDRLISTASTLNPRTNKREPFSSCVDELLRVASAMGAENIVTTHRLQPFAPEYFREGPLHSFDGFQFQIAKRLADADAPGAVPFAGTVISGATPPPTEVIALAELIAFWKSPAKAFLKASGIALPGEEPVDSDLDYPPLKLDALENWKVKDAACADALSQSPAPARTPARLAADRALPPGDLGRNVWASAQSASAGIVEALKSHLGNRVALRAELDGGLVVTGEADLTSGNNALLFYRVGKFENAKHFLEPWLTALLAAASGNPLPSMLFDESHPDGLVLGELQNAKGTLGLLVRFYLEGRMRPVCYAPATSDKIAESLEKNPGYNTAAIAAGRAEWEKKPRNSGPPGEGLDEAARLAWRDRDPFADTDEWLELAAAISVPLRGWYKNKK